ncbi:MAG: cupin domain-containing protein [Hyphomonadaceae bacterium]|nr:cupin domain-containing protein [Hyphomonadaceae bacterium]
MASSPSTAPRRLLNPVTGDRLEFLSSPLHGDPGPLVFRCTLAAHAKGSPLHFHRTIAETFTVERGLLAMEIGGPRRTQTLGAGDHVAFAPGEAHSFRNPLGEPTVFVSTATPGDAFEKFLRTMAGLAADGRTDADGMPTDPRALALALHYADLVLPFAPQGLQGVLVGGLARLGRLMGVERAFDRYWTQAQDVGALAEAA